SADDASHARLAELRIDGDFHEHGTEGMHGESLRLVARLHVYRDLDRFSDATHGFGETSDPTARERIVARSCARGRHGAAHARHARADQQAPIVHRARLWITPVPPEALCANAIAFARRSTRERQLLELVLFWLVAQAELDGIEVQRHRELIHRAFECEDSAHL